MAPVGVPTTTGGWSIISAHGGPAR